MDRKWVLLVPVIILAVLLAGYLVGLNPARSDSQVPDTIEKGQRLLSREEQVDCMLECYEDAGKVIGAGRHTPIYDNQVRAIFASAFFLYRTR